jgi:hypothetical protein
LRRYKAMQLKFPFILSFPVTMALLLGCVVSTDPPATTFHFIRTGSPDTIAPWGTLTIVFSQPLDDTEIPTFFLRPTVHSYTALPVATRDTVFVRFTEPLSGNRRYLLRAQDSMTAKNSAVLRHTADSLVFFTWPAEQEPNNTPQLADTLFQRCFGTIATVNDTDWYIITNSSARAVYLSSVTTQSTFFLVSLAGTTTPVRSFKISDTLAVPDGFRSPFYAAVVSFNRSAGGYYEIGLTTPTTPLSK